MRGDADTIIEQMEARASKRHGNCKRPAYHLSVSPAPSDRDIDDGEWVEIAQKVSEDMGWDDRQWIAQLHEDTTFPDGDRPRPHLHMVANLIGDDGKMANVDWDYYRIQNTLRDVEQDMGLSLVANSWEVDRRRDTSGQVARQQREQRQYERGEREALPEPSVRVQLQEDIEQAIKRAGQSGSLDDLFEGLSQSNVTTRKTENGWSLEKNGVFFGGYQLGPDYTLKSATASASKFQQALEHSPAELTPENAEEKLMVFLNDRTPPEIYEEGGTDTMRLTRNGRPDVDYRIDFKGDEREGKVEITARDVRNQTTMLEATKHEDRSVEIHRSVVPCGVVSKLYEQFGEPPERELARQLQPGRETEAPESKSKEDETARQQERVERVAPVVAKAMQVFDVQRIEERRWRLAGKFHDAEYDEGEGRLRLWEKDGRPVMNATVDKGGNWHDEGSRLTAAYVERIEEEVVPQIAKQEEENAKSAARGSPSRSSGGMER